MNVRVRMGVSEDAAWMHALRLNVLQEGRYFITEPDELTETPEQLAQQVGVLGDRANACCMVALVQGQPVGFLTVQPGPLRRMRHAGKLEVMVSRKARGQGAGRALMQRCVQWAEANTLITKLGLNVFAHNTSAIGLYRSFGFVEEGRRLREYRLRTGEYWDDVLMSRVCEAPEDRGLEMFG